MDARLHQLHLEGGRICGQDRTCGKKQPFSSEETAQKGADAHNRWEKRKHDVEPYPCYFCGQWHNGGIMTVEVMVAIIASASLETGEEQGMDRSLP